MTATNMLACAAFWATMGALWLLASGSWRSAAYTALLAVLCGGEAQARVREGW